MSFITMVGKGTKLHAGQVCINLIYQKYRQTLYLKLTDSPEVAAKRFTREWTRMQRNLAMPSIREQYDIKDESESAPEKK